MTHCLRRISYPWGNRAKGAWENRAFGAVGNRAFGAVGNRAFGAVGNRAFGAVTKHTRRMTFGILLVLCACESDSGNVLARAAGHELTVDQIVEVLARQNTVPNEADIVEALANFWVDYTLIGVTAREDSLLASLDLGPLLQPQLDQEVIERYLNSTVQPDTLISEADLRSMWEADAPPDSVRAQHILLAIPNPATGAQLDSIDALADRLRARAIAGESFDVLAGQYSDDSGSAVRGGDLGFFGPGMMVPQFEETAFGLAVGEVDLVTSPFGIHVIKVTERKTPTFEDARSDFRNSIFIERFRHADSLFLAEIDAEGEIEIEGGAIGVLRALATSPKTPVSRRAARRTLVSYRGGSYTVSDALILLNTQRADLPAQLAAAPDEAVEALLTSLGQAQVLLARAEAAGIGVTSERVDSLDALARQGIRAALDDLGILVITPLEGETADAALDRITLQLLRELSAGTRSAIPLDAITIGLRGRIDWNVLESSITATIERVDNLRGTVPEGVALPRPGPSQPAAPILADSVGN
jgi:parvulin-like peptidyl-prolyl isomerase